jgi:hypothetical protein
MKPEVDYYVHKGPPLVTGQSSSYITKENYEHKAKEVRKVMNEE